MKIRRVHLHNFRNLKDLRLSFPDGVTVIAGKNAQGKTNILEGIYLAASLRSFRASREEVMILAGQDEASVDVTFEQNGREHEISVMLNRRGGKKVTIDGRRAEKNRDALGLFQSVVFTPDHLMMIKGAPQERREFIDIAICATDTRYTEALLRYNKTLKNRNRLLKEIENDPSLAATLPVWDEMMAATGGYVAKCRAEYIRQLDLAAGRIYEEISGGQEKIKLLYLNQFSKDEKTEEQYGELIRERLEKTRGRDIENGMTGSGVHKDDILIMIGGKSAKFFASQGQIRSVALSVKLGEAVISEARTGEMPVILLDDIFSELDGNRQKFIMDHTLKNQCIVTTCEPEKMRYPGAATLFIEKGEIQCTST